MNLKKELIVVFHPYIKPGAERLYRYRVISANRLHLHIGIDRTISEINKFFNSGKEKDNFYVKQCGKVYLYRK